MHVEVYGPPSDDKPEMMQGISFSPFTHLDKLICCRLDR